MASMIPIPDWSGAESQSMPLRAAWSLLGLFESTDYARRAIAAHAKRRGVHDYEPNAREGRDIVACVKQGHGYFDAAEDASLLVSPLLLFYGVASLAKAVIIARLPRKTLHQMARAHGLGATGLDLSGSETRELTSKLMGFTAAIEQRGTFMEYAEALNIPVSFRVFDQSVKKAATLVMPTVNFADLPGKGLSLGDLLSRQPALRSVYHHAIGNKPLNFLGIASHSYMKDVSSYDLHFSNDPESKDLEGDVTALFAFNGKPHSPHPGGLPCDQLGHSCLCIPSADPVPMFPLSSNLGVGYTSANVAGYFIAPFSFGVVGEALQLYALSYLLGMLVRYFPNSWMQLVSGGAGDSAMPLLRSATDLIRSRFPVLALAGLTGYPHELSFSA
jgi:hypothetical protein